MFEISRSDAIKVIDSCEYCKVSDGNTAVKELKDWCDAVISAPLEKMSIEISFADARDICTSLEKCAVCNKTDI